MRILYITPFDVDDVSNGAAQRSHHLYRALMRIGDVAVVRTASLERGLLKSVFRRAVNAVLPGLLLPLTRVELGTFDAVVVRYVRYASYYSAWRFGPLYVDADDLPEDVCPRWAKVVFRRWSKWVMRRAKVVWLANPSDLVRIDHLGAMPLENIPLPPGAEYRFDAPQKNAFITVAHLGYSPNVRGIDRFLREEWSEWRRKRPGLEYRIIGKIPSQRLADRWERHPGVKVLGFVRDVDSEYESCCGVVCPVYDGGGTNVKVLEALAHRRPAIGPGFALRGVGSRVGGPDDFNRQVATAMADGQRVPVVFSADDRYALPLWIAVKSLLAAKRPETRYDVVVLVDRFSEKNRERFRRWFPGIRFVEVDPRPFADLPLGHVSLSSFNRLLAAEALPECERLIWSDVDVLFKGDLSDVYRRGCGGSDWCGVAMERRGETNGIHNHFPENVKPYVYAPGFMVVDAGKWRDGGFVERFREVARKYGERLTMQDLDVLNLACDSIGRIPYDYCVFESIRHSRELEDAKEYRFLRNVYKDEELQSARDNPVVVHYCGINPKVWLRSNREIPAEYLEFWNRSPLRPGWLRRRIADLKYVTLGIRGRRRE